MSAAISGPLLSLEYLRAEDARQPFALPPARVATYRQQRLHVGRVVGPATHATAVVPAAVVPLARWLGWSASPGSAFAADGGWWCPLAAARADDIRLFVTAGALTESHCRRAVKAALCEGARWTMLTDGQLLRLIDGLRGVTRGYLEFDLDACTDDGAALTWLARLLGPSAFVRGGDSSLTRWLDESDAFGRRVCRLLRAGVADALTTFTEAVAAAAPGRTRDASVCYSDALTAVYRVLFLLFAEARQMVPMWHPIYRRGYSIDALRARLVGHRDLTGTWAALQAIARLAHAGGTAGNLRVTAFNGRLFAPARAPLLDHLALDDGMVGRALGALCFTASGAGGRQRIAYSELGVEELGSVYESLLDLEPASHPMGHAAPPARPRLSASAARKTTGTFYTPRSIADALVADTLTPLVTNCRPDAILSLRVLDPAMGSGAFLVAAARFLASAWERAIVDTGDASASDISEADRAATRRVIASRCLFGVDRNPMAVQLAQLSVWLATLAADRPLSFLDHHLVAGNSLVGASPVDVLAQAPSRRPGRGPLPLDALFEWTGALAGIRVARRRLEDASDDSAAVVRAKETALGSVARDPDLARWKAACDLWCAAWAPVLDRGVYHALLDRVLGRASASSPLFDKTRRVLESRARAMACFHWPLEFPEIFLDDDGRPRPDGGFDAVIGNPPWEMLRGDRRRSPDTRGDAEALVRFVRDSGLYKYQGRGHSNQFQIFVERALHLARPGGRIGLIVPATVLGDDGSEPLRRGLLVANGVDAVTVYDNRRGLFPIHRSVRFAAITVGRRMRTTGIRCRFGVVDPADVAPGVAAAPPVVTLTPSLIERLSGPGLGIPDLPTPDDLRLVEAMHAAHPRLGSPSGWHVSFSRELNATDDRDCIREASVKDDDLPVLEGRHLEPFRVAVSRATRHADRARSRERLGTRDRIGRCRLAYREVASASNRTTLIAAILPADTVSVHTIFVLRERLPIRSQHALCALLNSFVANYLVRRRVTTHVTAGIIASLPVPRATDWFDELAATAAALRIADDAEVAVRCQAAAAEAYGLSAEDLRHVLATFPLVPQEERAAVLDAFVSRTRRRSCRSGAPAPRQ